MDILDCDWKFKFQCPQRWDALKAGDDQAIRYCETCQKNVYLCTTHREVGDHASQGHCVAVAIPELGIDEMDQCLIGDVVDDCSAEPVPLIKLQRWMAALLIVSVIALVSWLIYGRA